MTRRAWALIALAVVLPGSPQMVAGNRAVGRVAVGIVALLWALLLTAVLVQVVQADVLVGILTSSTGLTVLQVGLLVLAAGWLALTLDTIRIARIVRLTPLARPLVAGLLVVLAVAGAGGAGWGTYLAGVARGAIVSVFPEALPERGTAAPARYGILLLGMQRTGGSTALVPQSVSVLSVDRATGRAVTIGIPVQLSRMPLPAASPMHRLYPNGYGAAGCIAKPCTLQSLFSEAQAVGDSLYPGRRTDHSSPGTDAMREAVEGSLGIDLQYTVQLDQDSFGRLVDSVGGVTVTVGRRPLPGFAPGAQHLGGARAVAYLHGSGSDYGRVARTQQVEAALLTQANPANLLLQFRTVAAAGAGAVVTDLPQGVLTDLTVLALTHRSQPLQQLDLVPPALPNPSAPDYAAVRRLVEAALH
ncbi:MAG TPA: LCP family protein [Amnibacterium sp.]|nr:LCP family protein [Amnibacterium sp.]